MPSESYKKVCRQLSYGNNASNLAEQCGVDDENFKLIKTAFEGFWDSDIKSPLRYVAENLIRNGIGEEKFIEITGYTRGSTLRLFKEVLFGQTRITNEMFLELVCAKYGLEKDKTIKEQCFQKRRKNG